MKRNSTCPFRLQRAAGWCKTADEAQGTHLGVAARNPNESRRRRNSPAVIRERYTDYNFPYRRAHDFSMN